MTDELPRETPEGLQGVAIGIALMILLFLIVMGAVSCRDSIYKKGYLNAQDNCVQSVERKLNKVIESMEEGE